MARTKSEGWYLKGTEPAMDLPPLKAGPAWAWMAEEIRRRPKAKKVSSFQPPGSWVLIEDSPQGFRFLGFRNRARVRHRVFP